MTRNKKKSQNGKFIIIGLIIIIFILLLLLIQNSKRTGNESSNDKLATCLAKAAFEYSEGWTWGGEITSIECKYSSNSGNINYYSCKQRIGNDKRKIDEDGGSWFTISYNIEDGTWWNDDRASFSEIDKTKKRKRCK